jgi:hypothetical protein
MENKHLNRRQTFLLKWSPLLSVASLLWLIVSLWRGPLYFYYLSVCSGIALIYGALSIRSYYQNIGLLTAFSVALLVITERFARNAFVGDITDSDLGWGFASQYASLLLLSVFGLSWFFRSRILKQSGRYDI